MTHIPAEAVTKLATDLVADLTDEELRDRTLAITMVSKAIDKVYPGMLQRERRRTIAARHVARARQKRNIQ